MKSSEHMMVSSKTPQDLEQTTMITRIRQDKAYRIKFVRTLCILFSYITLGYFYGNLGPALPDIQLLTGQSLDVVSWLFTATYAGSMIGTLICGPVCDRVGPQIVLFVSVFMASFLTGVLFYSPNFTTMIVVRVFTGIFIGGVDLGGIASIADIWRAEARPYMHALQCMISIGGIITPFIIEPFLARVTNQVYTNTSSNISMEEIRIDLNISSGATFPYSEEFDFLVIPKRNSTIKPECNSNTSDCFNTISAEATLKGETQIQYAFIILAVTGVVASISVFVFVMLDCRIRNNQTTLKIPDKKGSEILNRTEYTFSHKMKILLLGITAIQSYLSAALGLKVYALLPSFFVIQFGWTTSEASVATSGFWIGKAVARFAGIFLSSKIKQSLMIPLFSIIYILSAVSLTVAAIYRVNTLAWVVTATMGVGLSVLRSCLFTMTEEKITHVSGKVASLYLVFFLLGGVLDPLYTGYLMDDNSTMWFTYLLVFESSLFLVLFVVVKLLLKFGNKQEIGLEIEIKPINE